MNKKLAKLAITQIANQDLTAMLEKVNLNFTQGKITKIKLLSWIVSNFDKNYFKKSILKIQKENIDAVMQVENLLKKAKQAKKDGQELDFRKSLSTHQ